MGLGLTEMISEGDRAGKVIARAEELSDTTLDSQQILELADEYVVLSHGEVVDRWQVAARGRNC